MYTATAVAAVADNSAINQPTLTTVDELFQLYISLPDSFKGPGLYPGDLFPLGSVYYDQDNNVFNIPANGVFMGTETLYNGTTDAYKLYPDGVPTKVPANSEVTLPLVNFPVPAPIGMYTQKLIINNTGICRYTDDGLQAVESVINNTPYSIIAVSKGASFYVKSYTIQHFKDSKVGVILPPGTEKYSENGDEIIEVSGATFPTEYMSVSHMSNTTCGTLNDVQASNYTTTNTSPFDIMVPMTATTTNHIYNQSNQSVQVISHGVTYTLYINQSRQFDYGATILLKANIQPLAYDGSVVKLSGTQAVSDLTKVTVQTVDPSLRPAHLIKPPALDSSQDPKDKPPPSQLVGVDMAAISPHVNLFMKAWYGITNTVFFVINGIADGLENAISTAPTTIKHIPRNIEAIPKDIMGLPSDVKAAGKMFYGIEKKVSVFGIANTLTKASIKYINRPDKLTTPISIESAPIDGSESTTNTLVTAAPVLLEATPKPKPTTDTDSDSTSTSTSNSNSNLTST